MAPADARFYTNFSRDLARRNRLSEQQFLRWAFHPGMLFNSRMKWWGDMGRRRTPHEGLDIGFFLDLAGRPVPLPDRAAVPAMFEGEILPFGEDDFFGHTLYVKHPLVQESGKVFCTIYGHVTPHPGLHPGKAVRTGETIASVSDFGAPKSGIRAHLHLSVAWIVESCTRETLTWKIINDPGKVQLLDPIAFFADPYSVIENTPP